MIKAFKYFTDHLCSNSQTKLVWILINSKNSLKELKLINFYFSFNKATGDIFLNDREKDINIANSEIEISSLKSEYSRIITELKKENDFDSNLHWKLDQIAKQISLLTATLKQQKIDIVTLKDEVEWQPIKYEPLIFLLIELGLPIVSFADCIWWGNLKNSDYTPHKNVFLLLSKLKINPSEGMKTNFDMIKLALINDGLVNAEEKIVNRDSHYEYIETMRKNQETLTKVDRLSQTNPNKLKDFKR